MKFNLNQISKILLTLVFLLSGVGKIFKYYFNVVGFNAATNIPMFLSYFIMIGVIVIEIVAPLIIIFSKNNKLIKKAIQTLIIFTILASLIYHFPPTGLNYYPFLKNLSLIGGLISLFKSI